MKRRDIAWASALAAGVLAMVVAPGAASAQVMDYLGIHPVNPHQGDFCYIDVPHVHAVLPADLRVYRELGRGEYLFVGDPLALGFDGTKYAYAGPHLLAMPDAPAAAARFYCYIQRPHYHAHAPAPSAQGSFVLKDGVYWYMGEFGPEFEAGKTNAWINSTGAVAQYRAPPVSTGAEPPGYKGPAVVPPRPVMPIPLPVPAPPPPAKGAGAKARADKAPKVAKPGEAAP
jgi:hypothetical protein